MMNIVFGIDFGTTNSVMSIYNKGIVEVIDLDEKSQSAKTLKSVIFFDEDGNVSVGQNAIDQYVEYGGIYGRFMQSIKAFLPSKSFNGTYIFGKRYSIEDLVSIILKEMKHKGELHVGHVVDTVFMGRPVVFSENKNEDLLAEERLREAALKAGFVNIQFVYEPIAATLAYEVTLKSDEEKLVLMGDFGGGTSDFVVMRLKGGQEKFFEERDKDILATGGAYIGGDTFDGLIMWEKVAKYFGKDVTYPSATGTILDMPKAITRTLCQWHMIPQLRDKQTLQSIRLITSIASDKQAVKNLETLILENLGYMVFRSIEKAKCNLSNNEESVIHFTDKDIQVSERIIRSEFEQISRNELSKLGLCIDDVLSKADVSEKDIDVVLLTGGTSFIPAVRKIFFDKFGNDKINPMDAFTSVAHGLGLISVVR